jgi:hypothetical protein
MEEDTVEVIEDVVTGDQETVKWTRYDFTSSWRDTGLAFAVWKAEQGGVTAAGPSPGVTRARLAALHEDQARTSK